MDEDGINPTPEKRAHKPVRATRKRAAKALPLDSPEKDPGSHPPKPFRPFTANFERAPHTSSQPSKNDPGVPTEPSHEPATQPRPEDQTGAFQFESNFPPLDDFEELASSTSRFPSSSNPNQEDRRHGEEENWAAIRPECQRRFVETFHAL
jgi:hypothetical protein